ncbi:hypothetical protein F2Q69_00019920 [Brassica cretica]|uniref:Uncharacterized protein n=1 Tax=Brassica cretica TaxID=69181 RepID=A0A8S9QFJ5_BRACR|nr:hypothetical protein F2Q69_00019920 [Brassica cretica]
MNWSRSWSKFCDSDRIVPNSSRSASGLWCWVERLAMFLFDCWLVGRFGGVTVSIFEASTMASWDSGCLMGRVRFGFLRLVQSVSAMRAVDGRSSSYVFNVSEGNRPQLTASSSVFTYLFSWCRF